MTTNAYTLEAWITAFRSELNKVSDFMTQLAISDGKEAVILTDETVLNKYSTELSAYLKNIDLTQREQEYYAYNPRLLAYDLYGAPEFWYLILYANEIHSALEFHLKRIKFFDVSVVNVLNEIRMLEKDRLDANNQEITDIIVGNKSVNSDIDEDLFD